MNFIKTPPTQPISPYMLTNIEENYECWQLQDVSVDNNETQHQHPVESNDKEDANDAKKDGSTEEKGNEAEN